MRRLIGPLFVALPITMVLLWCAVWVTLGYVAAHFIVKFW